MTDAGKLGSEKARRLGRKEGERIRR